MTNFFKELLAFTKGERQGILVLLFVIVLLLLANVLMPFFINQKPTDFSEFSKEIEAFEKQFQNDSSSHYKTKQDFNSKTSEEQLMPVHEDESEKQKLDSSDFKKKIYDYPKKDYAYNKLHIDLNTADTTELMKLRGIGSTFAKRIVKYREMLGGYYSIEQLKEVYGFDEEKYEMVKDEVYVNNETVMKMNLNKATAKELSNHVYIDWKLANAIVNHRFKQPFTDVSQLKEVYLVNDTLFRKLAPYFTIEK